MLNPKQARFAEEYVVDFNATQAAIRAGYSPKTACSQAEQLLRKLDVQSEVQRLQGEISKRTKVSADEVIEGLAAIAFSPITDALTVADGQLSAKDSSQWSKAAQMAVESVRQTKDGISIKMANKTAALEKLGQYLGLFKDFNAALEALSRYGFITTEDETGHDIDKSFRWQASLEDDTNANP